MILCFSLGLRLFSFLWYILHQLLLFPHLLHDKKEQPGCLPACDPPCLRLRSHVGHRRCLLVHRQQSTLRTCQFSHYYNGECL